VTTVSAVPRYVTLPVPPLAGWWRRLAAVLLDDLILAAVTWAGFGGGSTTWSLHPPFGAVAGSPTAGPPASWGPAAVAVTLLTFVLLQAYTGMTPGKRVAGVAVVSADTGVPAGFGSTLARPFLHVLDGVVLIGYLRPLWHGRRQTFADSILGTVAVATRSPLPHPALRRPRPPTERGRTLVTAAAIAACAAGAVFAFPTSASGTFGDVGRPVACPVSVPSGTPDVGAEAVLHAARAEQTERRLWVVRDLLPGPTGFRVRWEWSDELTGSSGLLRTRVSLTGDGPGAIWEESVDLAGQVSAETSVPGEDLTGLTADGWVEAVLLVDGVPMASCRAPAADLLGD
jgi:Mce-associated membrane protein